MHPRLMIEPGAIVEQHGCGRLAGEEDDVGFGGGISERGVEDRGWSFWKSRDLGDFFGFHVAQLQHHLPGLFGFGSTLWRQGNVVGVGADSVVEVVFGEGEERLPGGGEAPEAATRRFGTGKLSYAAG